jgi:hypothetical protein
MTTTCEEMLKENDGLGSCPASYANTFIVSVKSITFDLACA